MADIMAVLERARSYEQEILVNLEHIERLHRIASRASSNAERAVKIAEKLDELERALNAQVDRTVDAKLEAYDYISILEGEERSVIERYYILAMPWREIASKMYMSDRRVYMLRSSALAKMREHFGGVSRHEEPLRTRQEQSF